MKIGIFDSGFGGLTIFKSIQARLPQYDYVYLGDNARTPYGNRSFEAIFQFSKQCLDILFAQDCHLVIIACNTASAKALRTIQQKVLPAEYPDRHVLGIIRPSAEALGNLARIEGSAPVALWATEGTVKSMSFPLELHRLAPDLTLIQQACPMLVPLVEAGELEGIGIDFFIEKYWKQTLAQTTTVKPSALLLACTHYPLLYSRIRSHLPSDVEILVQGDIVAPSLIDYLFRHPEIESKLSRGQSECFLTTDQSEGLDRLAKVFLGRSVISEKVEI